MGLSAADATEPDPRGLPVAVAAAVVVGFPCFMCIPSIHAVVSTPVELQSAFVAFLPLQRWPSPCVRQVGFHD